MPPGMIGNQSNGWETNKVFVRAHTFRLTLRRCKGSGDNFDRFLQNAKKYYIYTLKFDEFKQHYALL